jgi:glycosyltransferase involved in cell wall biosynthesis
MATASRWLDGSRLVARIVAVCQAIKDDLVRQGLPAAKIDVVYSGTDTTRFDPARATGDGVRRELGLDPGTPLVTQVGVREPKGNDDLLRAFARLRAARPDARLLLVGARPEKRTPLEALARAGGLGDTVTIWGYRDDVPEILAATDVSVDASHVGLGITGTLRESLAMETPVVATRAMGNPELVGHEINGLLVPPRDPEALAAAVLRLLADPAWARELGRAGRRRVLAGFSTQAKVERLESLYARVTTLAPARD